MARSDSRLSSGPLSTAQPLIITAESMVPKTAPIRNFVVINFLQIIHLPPSRGILDSTHDGGEMSQKYVVPSRDSAEG